MSETATTLALGSDAGEACAFSIERGDGGELRIAGRVTFADAAELWRELHRLSEETASGGTLDLELSKVSFVDGAGMALLVQLRAELQQRHVKSELTGASEKIQSIIHLYRGDATVGRRKKKRPKGTLDQVGRATIEILIEIQLVLAFFGQMLLATLNSIRSPKTVNWREVGPSMERNGADAVPIIMLINFLVGLAMAYQSSAQLKQYGANHLLSHLIGISVARELGPLMTAIVICGRSGAAFAAELGSMRVNEEVDALRTMGFGAMRYLVIPRTLALVLVQPLLTVLADGAGMLGGLIVGVLNLDLTIIGYIHETAKAVTRWDFASGLVKSVAFAIAIALIACQQGLATSGGAEGVGKRTTSSVVVTLFTLIVIDAVLTVFFRVAGR